jgi:hypothetical protein
MTKRCQKSGDDLVRALLLFCGAASRDESHCRSLSLFACRCDNSRIRIDLYAASATDVAQCHESAIANAQPQSSDPIVRLTEDMPCILPSLSAC